MAYFYLIFTLIEALTSLLMDYERAVSLRMSTAQLMDPQHHKKLKLIDRFCDKNRVNEQ